MAENETPEATPPQEPEPIERRRVVIEYTIKAPRSPRQTPRPGASLDSHIRSILRSSNRMRPL